jgi:hypothetical protein
MPSPSSIFSFDTLQVRWGIPRGLLAALVLLAAMDFGLSRADWPYRRYPSSYVGAFLSQEQTLHHDPIAPRIIILGNSRSKAGLLPREMERLIGLPEGAVLNLSIESGDHYDNYLFQRRNRQEMKPARLLVYGVDAYEWNANFPLSERFAHFAGLADRLRLDPSAESLFGWFFRTEQKSALYHAIFRRMKARLIPASPVPAGTETSDSQDVPTAAPTSLSPVEGRVSFWYKNFKLSPARDALLQQTVRTAREDGQRVVILQLPFRDEYMREVFRAHAADYDAYKQRLFSVDASQVALFEAASACGLEPSDFQDWDHLDTAGAMKFTHRWYEWLMAHEKDTMAAVTAGTK